MNSPEMYWKSKIKICSNSSKCEDTKTINVWKHLENYIKFPKRASTSREFHPDFLSLPHYQAKKRWFISKENSWLHPSVVSLHTSNSIYSLERIGNRRDEWNIVLDIFSLSLNCTIFPPFPAVIAYGLERVLSRVTCTHTLTKIFQ